MSDIKITELIEIKSSILENRKRNRTVAENNKQIIALLKNRKIETIRIKKMLRVLILKSFFFKIARAFDLIKINIAIKLCRWVMALEEFKKTMNKEELKEIRKGLLFTQKEFAEKLGVSVQLFRLWEQGKKEIKLYYQNLILLTEEKYKVY